MSLDDLKLTPEEEQQAKEYEKWLEKHPFIKKWLVTCPGEVGRASPVYEKPKYAETINENEINIEDMDYPKPTRKEIEINRQNGRAGAYYSTGVMEKRPKRYEERMLDERGIVRPGELIDGQIPVGHNYNGVEVVNPQTDFNDTDQDYGCDEKQNLTLGEHILKEYAKDKKREEIKRDMSKYIMNDQEEEKIKNMLHLKEAKKDNDAVVPGDFDGICHDLMALHARKNKDYGNAADASYREFGLVSYVIRLNDKMNRLKSLTKPGVEQEVKSESIEDTLMDLAAYAIMAIESLRS